MYMTIKASSIHNVRFQFLFYSLYSLSDYLARAVDLLVSSTFSPIFSERFQSTREQEPAAQIINNEKLTPGTFRLLTHISLVLPVLSLC